MTDAAAQPCAPWESELTSVVVHARGAVCRRLARGVVPADGRIRVRGLPRVLDPLSLRAQVVAGSGLRVTGARIAVEAEPVAADAPEDLVRETERLAREQQRAEARRARQVRRIEEVTALRAVPPPRRREDPHRRAPVDAWLRLAEFVDERLAALHGELVDLEESLRQVEHQLGIARDRLARSSTDAPTAPVRTTVSADLSLRETGEGAAAGPVDIEIEYRVPGAVWVPSYRLTQRQGEDGGRLVLRASVAQRTGEDWSGVRLGLSTADLHRPTGVPSLRSVRIGRRQPAPAPSGWREPPAGLAGLFAGYDAAGPNPADQNWSAGGAAEAPVYAGSAPVAPGSARPRTAGRPRTSGALPPPAPAAPAAFGGPVPAPPGAVPAPLGAAPAPPPPPPGPPRPSAAELDYADLVLAGPEAPSGGRGLLAPGTPSDPVAAEYRRRAESVGSLPLPERAVRPRESAGSFDHRYDAEGPADIPSDGTWHTVTVTELPVGLRTEYLCVPSVEETVYATLVLTNATEQALLAGPVDVTADGEPLPTTALPTVAPGGTGRIGLGPAEAVRVSRRTELRESTAGLRNTTTVLDHRIHVELANRLSRPVAVEVRERVPVTSQADVRVEERADWTAPEEDRDTSEPRVPGTRLWRVDVPAGGTAVLDGGYEIRIPAAKALTGGNRRS
ncbi:MULTISPECIES: DUF4139 domain-containing protein [unclassified Streptomyces]|uniref:DUF4139 domain-containing protein n=1 Tax=unclassified Streptomyces TaxID=2593676 RepID=UPI000DBABAEA|nr:MULTISPECIES: DUF4139 domain-containing protein [unclassified Streptomyces]MYT75389.1 DUF4139 domain-containing protein [Streptomyces sp. SID8367]RAJ86791.1 uncharacterized protein DUF4139 [Streptomyces sp. PsTaAH-137]